MLVCHGFVINMINQKNVQHLLRYRNTNTGFFFSSHPDLNPTVGDSSSKTDDTVLTEDSSSKYEANSQMLHIQRSRYTDR